MSSIPAQDLLPARSHRWYQNVSAHWESPGGVSILRFRLCLVKFLLKGAEITGLSTRRAVVLLNTAAPHPVWDSDTPGQV